MLMCEEVNNFFYSAVRVGVGVVIIVYDSTILESAYSIKLKSSTITTSTTTTTSNKYL